MSGRLTCAPVPAHHVNLVAEVWRVHALCRRVAAYSCAGMALLWGFGNWGGGLADWVPSGIAEVTRDDGMIDESMILERDGGRSHSPKNGLLISLYAASLQTAGGLFFRPEQGDAQCMIWHDV